MSAHTHRPSLAPHGRTKLVIACIAWHTCVLAAVVLHGIAKVALQITVCYAHTWQRDASQSLPELRALQGPPGQGQEGGPHSHGRQVMLFTPNLTAPGHFASNGAPLLALYKHLRHYPLQSHLTSLTHKSFNRLWCERGLLDGAVLALWASATAVCCDWL